MCVWFSCVQLFRKLLLHKCQEEFENRRQATAGRHTTPPTVPSLLLLLLLSLPFLPPFLPLSSPLHPLPSILSPPSSPLHPLPSILYFFVPLSFPLFPVTAFDKRDGLTPEEEEQKIIAKRKMLGNIKFVGKTTCKDRVERLLKAATGVKLCNAVMLMQIPNFIHSTHATNTHCKHTPHTLPHMNPHIIR